MIRRSGHKIHTKVTQYFTDNNSTVGYSHVLTTSTESFCGTAFNYENIYSSSLANGKWHDCLYGPYTFCSSSTYNGACTSSNCGQFYMDTSAITIDSTGTVGDNTSGILLYTGSRLYLSSSLELAPDGYYASGGLYYKIGNGDCCGWNNGTFMSSGSCPTGSVPQGAYIDWVTGIKGAGAGVLKIRDSAGTVILDETTGTGVKNGTLFVTSSLLPYSVTGSWSAGSGNIVRYRICNIESGGELFYSGDIDLNTGSVAFLVSPTPLTTKVHLTSGGQTPTVCPV
jgi:hypothetical protein